jgi:3-oxoacyl-[acyl-carrier protein] reductase
MKLQDRVAIVTGAGGGIGSAICLALAGEGASIVVSDVAAEPANKAADQIRALGRKALVSLTDVTRSEDVRSMVKATFDQFGRIDLLVNVAGGSSKFRKPGYFHEMEDRGWNTVVDLNLKGTLICCHEVIKPMLRGGRGKIINIASVAGMMGSSIGMADYTAAKAGVIGFTKSLAKELGPLGITVNCVSPGPIETALQYELDLETQKKLVDGTYLKRVGRPEEVAHLVAFLASDQADFITGQNYAICGGRSLGW